MLPKFTSKERDFFKKLGDDSFRGQDRNPFLPSWSGILLALVLLGGLAGLLYWLTR
jgi:hypothetical protein